MCIIALSQWPSFGTVVEDLEILKQVNKITLNEAELDLKVKDKKSKINMCKADNIKLEAELLEIKTRLKDMKTGKRNNSCSVRRKCQTCETKDEGKCEHCFKCGSSEHFAKGCKSHFNQQGSLKKGETVTRMKSNTPKLTVTDISEINKKIDELQTDKMSACINNIKGNIYSNKKDQIVKLVGKECINDCFLNDKLTKCLWDTGAQVSLMPMKMIDKNNLKNLSKISHLSVSSASGDAIPFEGWLEMEFSIRVQTSNPPTVPFLVTDNLSISRPIIGFNVITHLISSMCTGGRFLSTNECI